MGAASLEDFAVNALGAEAGHRGWTWSSAPRLFAGKARNSESKQGTATLEEGGGAQERGVVVLVLVVLAPCPARGPGGPGAPVEGAPGGVATAFEEIADTPVGGGVRGAAAGAASGLGCACPSPDPGGPTILGSRGGPSRAAGLAKSPGKVRMAGWRSAPTMAENSTSPAMVTRARWPPGMMATPRTSRPAPRRAWRTCRGLGKRPRRAPRDADVQGVRSVARFAAEFGDLFSSVSDAPRVVVVPGR